MQHIKEGKAGAAWVVGEYDFLETLQEKSMFVMNVRK